MTFKDLCVDAIDAERLGTFWAGALGLELRAAGADSNGDVKLIGPTERHTIWINAVPEPKTVKHRWHLDLNVESVEQLTRLGATVVDSDSFPWTVMADPEGGEFCAFVREGAITQRLYEIGVDCGNSAQECHAVASWWAEKLGGHLVDSDEGYSYVDAIPEAPFDSLDFVPVPEPKTVKNRIHLDVYGDVDELIAAGATVLARGRAGRASGRCWPIRRATSSASSRRRRRTGSGSGKRRETTATRARSRENYESRSNTIAIPWPPPTHMVSRPNCLSWVWRLFSSVAVMRAPVMPNG